VSVRASRELHGRAVPAPPAAAIGVFGARLELAERYVRLLATDGIEHGLIGPRERDRLWIRHLLNCAVVAELIPSGARVVDVGSGAGLPGLALACVRPDLSVQLVEPLERRVRFLTNAVEILGLDEQVEVLHGRADDPAVLKVAGMADWVAARAVAPMDRLVRWCLPLLVSGGALLALKGARAPEELAEHAEQVQKLGARTPQIVHCGSAVLDEPTRVIVVRRR
jgi:16S rRNA (guanine527-N7)-methyltransferase